MSSLAGNPRLKRLAEIEEQERTLFAKSDKLFKQFIIARDDCSKAEVLMNLAEHEMLLAEEKAAIGDEHVRNETRRYWEAWQKCENIRERCSIKIEQKNSEAWRDEQRADEFDQKATYFRELGDDLLAEIYFCKSRAHGRSYQALEIEIKALEDEAARAQANAEKQAPNPPDANANRELEDIAAQTRETYERALANFRSFKESRDRLERAYEEARVEYVCAKNKYRRELTSVEMYTLRGRGRDYDRGCDCATAGAKHRKSDDV